MAHSLTRIIVHGCNGRMGRSLVTAIANAEGFSVAAGVDPGGTPQPDGTFPVYHSLDVVAEAADVIIDFSVPEATVALLDGAVKRQIPVVIATSGLGAEQSAAIEEAARVIPVLRAANLSIGITLLRAFARQGAAAIGDAFDVELVERYHRLKKDAPSGTSNALAQAIREGYAGKDATIHGRAGADSLRRENEIAIHSVRGGTIVGEHEVIFAGTDEVITLTHSSGSRSVFTSGALRAAAFIVAQRPGLYGMEEVLFPRKS